MTRRKRVLYDRCVGRHAALTIFFTAMAKLHEWLNISYIILKWVTDASLQETCRSFLGYIPWPLSSTLTYVPILRRRLDYHQSTISYIIDVCRSDTQTIPWSRQPTVVSESIALLVPPTVSHQYYVQLIGGHGLVSAAYISFTRSLDGIGLLRRKLLYCNDSRPMRLIVILSFFEKHILPCEIRFRSN